MTLKAQISAMVTKPTPVLKGTVTSVSEQSIFVSSPVGLKEFQVDNPSAYKVGDSVKFQGNTYLGRIPSNLTSTSYVV